MFLLMPQLSGQVHVCCCHFGESCIPGCCCRHEIHESIFHFTMFYIFGANISHCSFHFFDLFPVKVCFLEFFLESHSCEIICCDNLPNEILMCIFLHRNYFCDSHVCQLPIGKWQIPRYCELLTHFYLVGNDLY